MKQLRLLFLLALLGLSGCATTQPNTPGGYSPELPSHNPTPPPRP